MLYKPTPLLYWVARYSDGSSLVQYQDGEVSSEQIDRSKLSSFSLHDLAGNAVLSMHFKKGDLLAYRCRSILRTDKQDVERIHIISLIRNEVRVVTYVFEINFHVEVGDFAAGNGPNTATYRHEFIQVEADLMPIGGAY